MTYPDSQSHGPLWHAPARTGWIPDWAFPAALTVAAGPAALSDASAAPACVE